MCQESLSKFGLGIHFNPTLVNRTKRVTEEGENFRNTIMVYDRVKPGFASGVSIHFRIQERVRIETGINYTLRGYGVLKPVDLPDSTIIAILNIEGKYPIESRGRYNYHFLDFPLTIAYRIKSSEQISFYAKSGVSANLFFRVNTHFLTTFNNESTDNHSDYTDFSSIRESPFYNVNFSWQLALGTYLKITERAFLQFEPNFDMTIRPVWDDPDVKPHLYKVGLRIGLNYYL